MSVTVTFSNDDPSQLLKDMATMASVSAPVVSGASSDNGPKTGEPINTGGVTNVVEPAKPARNSRKPKNETPAEPPPPPPETPADTAAQDKADEAPEAKAPEAPLTLDDARNAATPYINKFGKEAASKDLQPIVLEATGGKTDRISGIDPADQATIKLVIAAFEKAGAAAERFVPKAKE